MNSVFNFIVPAELEKSKDGEWKIKGLASTAEVDQQGEIILQKGIDLTPIDNKRGIINFDHLKGPENTIGILDGYARDEKGIYIEGRLFKNHTKAKAVKEIMESLGQSDKGRMGLSVEGQIIERDPTNPKIIRKCRINAVALTMNPVNSSTYVDLVKSMTSSDIEFESVEVTEVTKTNEDQPIFTAKQVVEIVEKALAVGSGYQSAPNNLSGGAALATSDMDSDDKKDKKKKLKKMDKCMYKSNMLNMLNTLQDLYPGYSREQIWSAVKERINTVFPDINSEYPKSK